MHAEEAAAIGHWFRYASRNYGAPAQPTADKFCLKWKGSGNARMADGLILRQPLKVRGSAPISHANQKLIVP